MQVYLGQMNVASLRQHLPVPTFWQPGPTALTIAFTAYTSVPVQSVELWNRGSTDLYVNFNGVTASGPSATSTDLHLAPSEEWSGAVGVTSLSVISPQGTGALEVQVWG